ncbi:MAG: alpha/beta hydrolase [Hamadaea sp.]|nr:alpha/beta hydrolase [Hamadaea sp.]
MTEYLETDGGRIAYDIAGEGPLVILGHGLADTRKAYRFLAPQLVAAGYRVANADLRGHGESSTGWATYTRTDTAHDLIALIRHLGGPAVLIGHSFAGASAAIVAAQAPELVTAIEQIDPGTRAPKIKLGDVTGRFVKGITLIVAAMSFKSTGIWKSYLRVAYPGQRPADFEAYLTELQANLREPGRMTAAQKMGFATAADAEAALAQVKCPALVVMGDLDPDFHSPRAEAEGIAATMPAGIAEVAMIEGAGHYPHAQFPAAVAGVVLPFLSNHARA